MRELCDICKCIRTGCKEIERSKHICSPCRFGAAQDAGHEWSAYKQRGGCITTLIDKRRNREML